MAMQMDNGLTPALIAAVFPTVAALVGILVNNSRLNNVNTRIGELRQELSAVFTANLRRVEEVVDARLTHIEKELDHS